MKKLVLVIPFLFLSACVQLYVESGVHLSASLADDIIFKEVVLQLEQKADELGSECEFRYEDRNYILCPVYSSNDVRRIFAGISDKGVSFVAVQSLSSSFFVIPEEQLLAGELPAEKHEELEKWLFGTFSELQPIKKYRKFSGRGVELTF